MTEFPDTKPSLLQNIRCFDDREAWGEFVAIYRPAIYRMARRRGMQDFDAQDLAQDVLVRVARAIDQWVPQPGVRFRHWLRKVASNAILSAISRAPQDRPLGGTDPMTDLAQQPEMQQALSQELDREAEREQFLRAAAIVQRDVNAETWQAFELTVIEGLNCEQAAQRMNKSIGTIYAARSRILKRLQAEVKRAEGNIQ